MKYSPPLVLLYLLYTSRCEWAIICRQMCTQAIVKTCRRRPPFVLAHLRHDCAWHRHSASPAADGVFRLRPLCFREHPNAALGRLRCPQPDCPQRLLVTHCIPGDPVLGILLHLLTLLAGFAQIYSWLLLTAPSSSSPQPPPKTSLPGRALRPLMRLQAERQK